MAEEVGGVLVLVLVLVAADAVCVVDEGEMLLSLRW